MRETKFTNYFTSTEQRIEAAGALCQLNESTLWSGGPVPQSINPDAASHLAEIREVLFNEDYDKATPLAKKIQGLYTESYMPLGDLVIRQQFVDTVTTAYYRDLDIEHAVSER